MKVSIRGWDAVSPWREAVQEALSRANALLRGETLLRTLSPRAIKRLSHIDDDRRRAPSPSRITFNAAVGARFPVQVRCSGRVQLSVPSLFDMRVSALSRELVRAAILLKLRPQSCRHTFLVAAIRDQWLVDEVVDLAARLGSRVFRGPDPTIAARLGLTPSSPLERRTSRLRGRLEHLLERASAPQIFVELRGVKMNVARLRVNAKPWSRCRVGRGRMRTTPFEMTVGRHPIELRCEKDGTLQHILIARRLFSQPGVAGLALHYGRWAECTTKGRYIAGDAVTVSRGWQEHQRVLCHRPRSSQRGPFSR